MVLKLTEIARKTLEAYINDENFELDEETEDFYNEEKACFVTLNLGENLRGCIGCLDAEGKSLWKCVQDNTINAGFKDPRFPPLGREELDKVEIEVSVLTKPEKINFSDSGDLLNQIDQEMGLILKKGSRSSTFLPQVWEQIDNKINFLQYLCVKAGLDKDEWKSKDIEIFYYGVEIE